MFQVVMTTLLFGTGVGTFILVVVWSSALCLCCISLRTQRNIGPIAVSVALLVMLVLLLLPRGPQSEEQSIHKVYDYLFVWRVILVIVLTLSTVVAACLLLIESVMQPLHAKQIKGWII
ncbi:hypothetical protein LSTR_LSTR006028 [Laodelphax striatellus]|uniref:Transmembrane protein 218 n=1 Tax=Laodelphax striatellus TaxID=195883 RepID=A0A482XQ38_LAOST|nr:hypothetical protein LSTR_LSTR006028 [Laodelphax striatellus]